MPAELMPENYEPPQRKPGGGSNGESGELLDALKLARENPGRWIQVGPVRFMRKPPTSWVSEVRRGEKVALQVEGERWDANYEKIGTRTIGVDEVVEYEIRKMIRLLPN